MKKVLVISLFLFFAMLLLNITSSTGAETTCDITAIESVFNTEGASLEIIVKTLFVNGKSILNILAAAANQGINPYLVIKELLEAGADSNAVITAATTLGISNAIIAKAAMDSGVNPTAAGLGYQPVVADGPNPTLVGFPVSQSISQNFISNSVP